MKDYYPGNLGGNDKRFNRSHRPYDSPPLTKDMGGNQRRNGFQRKRGGQTHGAEASNEMLTTIKDQLQKISENQKRMADLQERSAVAEERKADAMEQLAEHLKQWIAPSAGVSVENETVAETLSVPRKEIPETVETVPEEGKSLLETITDMREKGITFGKIADHLNGEGVPPTSGADLWNRLTVSKFHKEAVAQ
ncbi:MAG: hypothetical protein H8E81_06920 [Deltaproteobacteria bacterium]|nr:hypothetical protein [Deltaproteobacteria bacterium]